MKTINLLLVALMLLLLSSCRKKHTVTLQAQNLQNPADGSHFKDKHYVVLEKGYFISHKAKQIAVGTFDNNGYASFDLKMKKNLRYVLGIEEPDNICYQEIELEYPIEYNEPNNITFNYAPCGWVKIYTNNINCEGNSDKLQYIYTHEKGYDIYVYRGFGDQNGWYDNAGTEGCKNLLSSLEQVPAGNYTFEWRVIRPSGTTTGIDYFTVTEGDTLTYVLEY